MFIRQATNLTDTLGKHLVTRISESDMVQVNKALKVSIFPKCYLGRNKGSCPLAVPKEGIDKRKQGTDRFKGKKRTQYI